MSDQQLVTGIAILIGGYSQLQCSLSYFHWSIIVELAWFSSVTHLCALTYVQTFLLHDRQALYLRLPIMLGLIGMLVAAFYPLQTADDGYAAQCLFNMSKEQLADIGFDNSPYFGSMVISQMMLVIMFLSRVIKLHQRSTCFTRKWLKNMPSRYWGCFVTFLGRVSQESSGWKLRICLLLHILSLVFSVTAMILVNLMSSLLWDVRTASCPIAR